MNKPILVMVITIFIACISYGQTNSNSTENSPRLDSIVVYNYSGSDSVKSEKQVYDYNENGDTIFDAGYVWNLELNGWIGVKKTEWSFDEAGNTTLETHYEWDSESNDWIGYNSTMFYGKIEYSYDKAGNQILKAYYYWYSELNDWILFSKCRYEYKFDEAGNLNLKVEYRWNLELNEWFAWEKTGYSYDETGNLTLYTRYLWHSGINDWVLFEEYKYEYSYDDTGNLTTLEAQYSSGYGFYKYEYSYDKTGNQILVTYYERNWGYWELIFLKKYEYKNDSVGNRTLEVIYEWDAGLNDWVCLNPNSEDQCKYEYGTYADENQILIENIYDESGNLATQLYYSSISDHWVLTSFHEPVFDETGNRIFDVVYTWNTGLNEWTISSKIFYYYSTSSTGIHQLAVEDIIFYPNPTTGILNISGLNYPVAVNIYNTNGQLLKSFQQVNNTIDISELTTGVYILSIRSKNIAVTKKIIKQ